MNLCRLAAATALGLILLAGPASGAPQVGGSALSALDVIELEIGYTTMLAQFYRPVTGEQLMGGARRGIAAYLASRGIVRPVVPPAPGHPDRWRAENEIVRDVALVMQRYGARVDPTALVEAAVAGELASVHDPYTLLFKPKAYHQFVNALDGTDFGGIGVELAIDPATKAVRAANVFPDGPADKAGLAQDDLLATVDGRPAEALAGDALRAALRGKPGTVVHVGVIRAGVLLPAPLAITRAKISPPDATVRLMPGAVGYVQLRSFGAHADEQLASGLRKLAAQGARAYVLDLRNNGGGYRDAAIDVASHFVTSGPIVSTRERTGARVVYSARKTSTIGNAPLAVLVNADTASASEIVAGAIQDARAGTLVGEKTFGKGVVQQVYPLPSGSAMKITTARYATPSGRDIDRTGIQPDIVVGQPKDATLGQPGKDPQLDRALATVAQPSVSLQTQLELFVAVRAR